MLGVVTALKSAREAYHRADPDPDPAAHADVDDADYVMDSNYSGLVQT